MKKCVKVVGIAIATMALAISFSGCGNLAAAVSLMV